MIIKSSSSGINGWSRLSGFLHCSAVAAENRARASALPFLPLPEEETTEKGNKPHPLVVGSLYGDLVQHYLRGTPPDANEPLYWDYGVENVPHQDLQKSHPASVSEALRCYIAYTKEFPNPAYLGRIIATEFPIVIPGKIFGLPFDITGSIDVVLETDRGIIIDDLKTESAEAKNLKDKFSVREQLWIYDLGYELATGIKPVGNMIDCCIKTKEPKFRKFEYEGLTDRRMRWLRHMVAIAYAEMQNPQPKPSIQNCNPWGTPCGYLQDGMCALIP